VGVPLTGRLEERVQRGVERLTLFRAVRMVATVALTLAFVAAILEMLVDSGINGFNNAMWWAIVTVTTVGYGDVVPETTPGRLVAAALMLVGVSAIPIATSLVVSVFITRMQAKQHAQDAADRIEIVNRLDRIESLLTRGDGGPGPSA
jgi:voltage-gated potassium channel